MDALNEAVHTGLRINEQVMKIEAQKLYGELTSGTADPRPTPPPKK